MSKYLLIATPFVTWIIIGTLKLFISSFKSRKINLSSVGYGGMPSNHSAIVSSVSTVLGMKDGFSSSIFLLSLSVAFLVIMDAVDLRRHIGLQSNIINKLYYSKYKKNKIRENIGHTLPQVFMGILLGALIALFIFHNSK
jgi:acid phosphatase family membrane protein YuiD